MTIIVSAFNLLVAKRVQREKLDEATVPLKTEIEKQIAKYGAEIETQEIKHKAEADVLKAEHKASIETQETKYKAEAEALKVEHKNEIEKQIAKYKADLDKREADLQHREDQQKLKEAEAEKAKQAEEIRKQNIAIDRLSDKVKLLEGAQLSVAKFEQILKVALLETNLKTKLVKRKSDDKPKDLTVKKWYGKKATVQGESTLDEILVILDYDINAVFGVDLKKIKVSKIDEKTVVFSGISPVHIAKPSCKPTLILEEMRTLYFKGDMTDNVVTKYDKTSVMEAAKYTRSVQDEFLDNIKTSDELCCMNAAVIELAKNFIKVMFAPLYGNNIIFEDKERPNALPIVEHIESEIEKNNALIEKNNALIEDAQIVE